MASWSCVFFVRGKKHLYSSLLWHAEDKDKFSDFISIAQDTTFSIGVGLSGRVWESKKAEFVYDVNLDDNFQRETTSKDSIIQSGFAFPILIEGRVVAVLEFFRIKLPL